MEEITGVPASRMLGKGDYEYAIPFYGERKPMLANLVMMRDDEVTERYNYGQKDGGYAGRRYFHPWFSSGGAWFWAKARPLRIVRGDNRCNRDDTRYHRQKTGGTGDGTDAGQTRPDNQFSPRCHVCHRQQRDGNRMEPCDGADNRSSGHGKCSGKGITNMPSRSTARRNRCSQTWSSCRVDEITRTVPFCRAKIGDTLVVDIFIPTFGASGDIFLGKGKPALQ